MRRVFLIRHGRPDFPLDKRLCLGRTDLPLGALGRMQARRLALWLPEPYGLPEVGGLLETGGLTAFSSPLKRAQETMLFFTENFTTIPELREMDSGDWDGLDFDEIRRRWPKVYAARGIDPSLPIPNAEPADAVRRRAMTALLNAMRASDGDLLIVAHRFVIRSILSAIDVPDALHLRIPYASVTTLTERDNVLEAERIGQEPDLPLDPSAADALLRAAAPGAKVEAHCRTVAEEAVRIASVLPQPVDTQLLKSAALLHDAARREKEHAKTAAAWLRELGYDKAASIVALHHDYEGETLDEAAILFIADKCVAEDRVVSLEERFLERASKYRPGEARLAHARRFAAAAALRARINAICQSEVIP